MTEIWKPVIGYETLYEVSNHGHMRTFPKLAGARGGKTRLLPAKDMKLRLDKTGRPIVVLWKNREKRLVRVCSLVAEAFIGPRPAGREVCHNDGDATHNHHTNLRYDTHRQNCRDRIAHGVQPRGEEVRQAKLTAHDVSAIRSMLGAVPQHVIAARFGVSQASISRIATETTWSHV